MTEKMNQNSQSRNKHTADYTLTDIYKAMKKTFSMKSRFYNVDRAKFMAVCADFNEIFMQEKVLRDPLGAKLPFKLGELRVKKYMPKPGAYCIDRKLSKEYRKKIVFFNEHTNGAICRIAWFTNKMRLTGRTRYSWTAVRLHSRQLSAILLDPDREIDYFE